MFHEGFRFCNKPSPENQVHRALFAHSSASSRIGLADFPIMYPTFRRATSKSRPGPKIQQCWHLGLSVYGKMVLQVGQRHSPEIRFPRLTETYLIACESSICLCKACKSSAALAISCVKSAFGIFLSDVIVYCSRSGYD